MCIHDDLIHDRNQISQCKIFSFQIVIKKIARISESGLMLAIYIFQTKTKKIVT